MQTTHRPLFGKISWNTFLAAPLLLCIFIMISAGCASHKASQRSPELPPRHWLEESPGVPVENKEKIDAAVPNLYNPDKVFSFDDCVYLTIQQSPVLAKSAVELEINKLQVTDAIWKYLPEPRMTLTTTSNLTQYNQGVTGTGSDYGTTKFRVGFHAAFPNPVMSYYNHQVQKVMVGLAVAMHRKAVGIAINELADIYLRVEAQRNIMEQQKALIPMAKELTAYWKQVEHIEGKQGASLSISRQKEREAELKLERSTKQELMLRTKLKVLAGVDPQQNLKINTTDAKDIVKIFKGQELQWENRWSSTEDDVILRTQIKIQDFNIMVAWARYVPDVTMGISQSPPAGRYQPIDGREDTFFHLTFDFPLIDWGSRYRKVQTARMEKAVAFQELAGKRGKYSNKWLEAQQGESLALTSLKIAQNTLEVAEMEYKEADINFREGIGDFPTLAKHKEALANAHIGVIEARLDYELAQLKWMDVANILQERYLGLPAKEIE